MICLSTKSTDHISNNFYLHGAKTDVNTPTNYIDTPFLPSHVPCHFGFFVNPNVRALMTQSLWLCNGGRILEWIMAQYNMMIHLNVHDRLGLELFEKTIPVNKMIHHVSGFSYSQVHLMFLFSLQDTLSQNFNFPFPVSSFAMLLH